MFNPAVVREGEIYRVKCADEQTLAEGGPVQSPLDGGDPSAHGHESLTAAAEKSLDEVTALKQQVQPAPESKPLCSGHVGRPARRPRRRKWSIKQTVGQERRRPESMTVVALLLNVVATSTSTLAAYPHQRITDY